MSFPYTIERGVRIPHEPMEVMGFRKVALETREPVVINEDIEAASAAIGQPIVLVGEPPKSTVFVPLLVGDRGVGVISLQNLDREQAFSDDDVRLLTTLAGSLTVALENARLFEETRQRNAELALVNDVQRGLAENLGMQAAYDFVGDRIQEIFDAQVVDIGILERNSRILHYPYSIERGVRYPDEPLDLDESSSLSRYVIDRAESVLITDRFTERMLEFGEVRVMGSGEVPKSVLFVPLVVGGRAIGRISLQNLDREHAFSEADARLLTTLAASLSVTLENLRLFDESQRRGTEMAALAELGREVGGLLDLDAVIRRIGERAKDLLRADTSAVFLEEGPGAERYLPLVALGRSAELIMADAIRLGEGVVGDLASRGAAEVVNDLDQRSAGGADPGFGGRRRGTPDGRPAPGSRPRDRDDGRLAVRAVRPLHRRGSQLPGRSLAAGGDRDRDRAPVPGDRPAEAVLRVARRHQPGRRRHDGSRRGRVRLEPGGRAPVRLLGAGRDRPHDRLARDQVIRVRGRGSGDRPRGVGAGPRAPADPPDASRREVRRGRGRHRAARGRRRSPGLLRGSTTT